MAGQGGGSTFAHYQGGLALEYNPVQGRGPPPGAGNKNPVEAWLVPAEKISREVLKDGEL